MKRKLFCLCLLLCLLFTSTALANEWGAPGSTVDLFDGTDYNAWRIIGEQLFSCKKTAQSQ